VAIKDVAVVIVALAVALEYGWGFTIEMNTSVYISLQVWPDIFGESLLSEVKLKIDVKLEL
jgi:hypothetical protein